MVYRAHFLLITLFFFFSLSVPLELARRGVREKKEKKKCRLRRLTEVIAFAFRWIANLGSARRGCARRESFRDLFSKTG